MCMLQFEEALASTVLNSVQIVTVPQQTSSLVVQCWELLQFSVAQEDHNGYL